MLLVGWSFIWFVLCWRCYHFHSCPLILYRHHKAKIVFDLISLDVLIISSDFVPSSCKCFSRLDFANLSRNLGDNISNSEVFDGDEPKSCIREHSQDFCMQPFQVINNSFHAFHAFCAPVEGKTNRLTENCFQPRISNISHTFSCNFEHIPANMQGIHETKYHDEDNDDVFM